MLGILANLPSSILGKIQLYWSHLILKHVLVLIHVTNAMVILMSPVLTIVGSWICKCFPPVHILLNVIIEIL